MVRLKAYTYIYAKFLNKTVSFKVVLSRKYPIRGHDSYNYSNYILYYLPWVKIFFIFFFSPMFQLCFTHKKTENGEKNNLFDKN